MGPYLLLSWPSIPPLLHRWTPPAYYPNPSKSQMGLDRGAPPFIFNLMVEHLAEAICSHPGVTGLQFGKSTHKINLFADDIIPLLTNPDSSLPEAFQIFTQFSHVSYYKVNATKLLILDLGVWSSTKWNLQRQLPLKWSDEGIPYIGITLTSSTTTLVAANYIPLLSKIYKELKRIAKCELSWGGRRAAAKMNILPQILYMFRSLSIPFPTWHLTSLSRSLKSYIWAGRRARCPYLCLIKHKTIGGAGFPDVKD